MDRTAAYEFIKLYAQFMASTSEYVKIMDIDPLREKVELKISVPGKPTVQRWYDFWYAAKAIEANSD